MLNQELDYPEIKEKEPTKRVGIALFVIDPENGKIRTITELKHKVGSRERGQLSIALETRKKEESIGENIFGALPELFNDTDTNGLNVQQHLIDNLFYLGSRSFYQSKIREFQGRPFECTVAIAFYTGKKEMTPFNNLEVAQPEWIHPRELLNEKIEGKSVRPLARDITRELLENGAYYDNFRTFHFSPQQRRRLLPQGFSIRETYINRERLSDIT